MLEIPFEMYVLYRDYERAGIVENFDSLIWHERFRGYGEFQLVLPGGSYNTQLYQVGRYLEFSLSARRLMFIESVKSGHDSDGKEVLTVAGKSFEAMLRERVVTTQRKYFGEPALIATQIVRTICVEGASLSPADAIEHFATVNPEPGSFETDADVRSKYLYDAVVELVTSDDFGFRIRYEPDIRSDFLVFYAFKGRNRTSLDVRNLDSAPTVVFSADNDNLNKVSHLRSNEEHKTVAYVWHDSRTSPLIVNAAPAAGTGQRRRVLSVDANDIQDATTTELRQRGREALAQHNFKDFVDGEVGDTRIFRYNFNYALGDLVEVWYPNGRKVQSRVIEHIWSFNSSGLRSYPTLEYVDDIPA